MGSCGVKYQGMVVIARKHGFSHQYRRRVEGGLISAQVSITYAIWAEGTDHIKLGKTEGSPWLRLRSLQTGAFSKLVLLAYTGTISERECHRRHRSSRVLVSLARKLALNSSSRIN
jgi:hypothetical protein